MQALSVLVFLALTLAATGTETIPLKRGAYVDTGRRCDSGHGYNYLRFDGRSLMYGTPPVVEKLTRQSEFAYVAQHRVGSGRLIHDELTIISPAEFVLSNEFGRFRQKHCSLSTLPDDWRRWSLAPNEN